MEQYFTANCIENEGKKRAVFLTVIGSKVYGLLQNLQAPTKPPKTTFEALIETLKDHHLSPKPLIIEKRFKFHKQNHHKDKSVAQYLVALRKLVLKSVTLMILCMDPAQEPIKAGAGVRALVLCGHADLSSCVGITTSSKHPVCTVIYTTSDRS